MKFLLTSSGLTNQSITRALFDLVGKAPSEIVIAFIPTAMNVDEGDKGWFVDDLNNIKKQKVKYLDIVDISALPKEVWLPRLEAADVLFFSGGNTSHLMKCLKESGLAAILPDMLKTRVYAGISAGSMVTNPMITLSNKDKKLYYEKVFGYSNEEGMHLVDVYIRPHLNSRFFPEVNKNYLEGMAKDFDFPIYALDDQSAITVVDGRVEVVTEGEYLRLD